MTAKTGAKAQDIDKLPDKGDGHPEGRHISTRACHWSSIAGSSSPAGVPPTPSLKATHALIIPMHAQLTVCDNSESLTTGFATRPTSPSSEKRRIYRFSDGVVGCAASPDSIL